MTGVVGHKGSRGVELVVGVDTHQDEHVAVAVDRQGVRLGELHTVATTHGYEELERWSRGLGEIHAFGIEGTGSYGAGVARFLTSRGHTVVEVNRPDRSTRYRKGKSDPTDAEMAARAVLAGVADATPKSGEGEVEMIRMFKSTKDSAVKARTQAINQMKALVVTAPARLREHLTGLTAAALVTRSKSFRPAVKLNPAGFNENLALAFALSGSGDNEGAIAALLKIDGERDEVFYRCLGHFQILVGDSDSAVASLQEAVNKTKPAKRPKILAPYGVAFLAQGNDKQALDTFNSASEARNPGRPYKADDELAFALCELGAGQTVSGVSKIKALATQYRHMKGLLSEFSVLLSVMQTRGIEGCDQCITSIDGALDTGSS